MTTQGLPSIAGPVVVMGASGSGKSLVGTLLAQRIGMPIVDGDDLHPAENIASMSKGVPVTDDMRWPWLDKVGRWLAEQKSGGVAACSALRRAHRDRLRPHSGATTFLHLDGPSDLIRARMVGREHFMPETLLDSQFATLERLDDDESGVALSLQQSPDLIVEGFISWARGRSV